MALSVSIREEERRDGGLEYCDTGDKLVTNLKYVAGHSCLQMLVLFNAVLYLITGYLSSTRDEDRCEVGGWELNLLYYVK
jgi:hypothetical protein